ncbi:MAG: ABC transporter substrate-binding protein [Burkholderiaceae bacterium]|nr:ABC transporter substrate-binding protein [Burkholderiaceae bacterium]
MALSLAGGAVFAQKRYDPGASDTTIRIGQTMPYSGPASAYGTIGKAQAAYFRMINERGGIGGRRIEFLSLDDGYSPPKAVEMTRRLVEGDEVLVVFGTLGTPSNSAIRKYLNDRRVPQLFAATGAAKWNDPRHFPWTMGGQPDYRTEARIYAQHILRTRPEARIGVLYQNDDFGKDYLAGLRDGLGARADAMIVAEASYQVTDPTVDSQIATLQGAGADVFVNVTTPKFAAQAIRRAYDIGWRPLQYLASVSVSVNSVMRAAGFEKGVGIVSSAYLMTPGDPEWNDEPAMREWRDWMAKYYPEGDTTDYLNVYGYVTAQLLVQVLRQAGDELTRENVMRQAAKLQRFAPKMMLPGITVETGEDDFAPFESLQLMRFDGKSWVRFGEVLGE